MAPSEQSLDGILQQITTTNNIPALNQSIKNLPKEARDVILASPLASGQDPLSVLDLRNNTLGVLYIMSARLTIGNAPPPWQMIAEFCQTFLPEQARCAPERVTMLAKGIIAFANHSNTAAAAIEPLLYLVTRFPPDSSYLTNIHPIFVLQCVVTQHFSIALPVLKYPITSISLILCPDLHYNDNLMYHYLGGIALAALKRWSEAEEFFEICVTSPGTAPAALQLEALKKLKLVQLISKGYTSSLPKYTNSLLLRMLKNSPYNSFINAYPSKVEQLNAILEKDQQLFASEKNLGLLGQALARAPRWTLKKLTATYVTLGLKDISRAIKIDDEDEVRALILSMIETNDISAQLSSDGTVTFSDPLPQFTREQVDYVLHQAQEQNAMLTQLDMDIGRSREFLSKALKSRDDWAAAGAIDDDLYSSNLQSATWDEQFS